MFIWATRTASVLTARALFYIGLFLFVVVLQVAITSALRSAGWSPALALLVSGAVVLAVVLGANYGAEVLRRRRAQAREALARALKLPDGPCCVVWATGEGESAMPWTLTEPLRVPYPALPKRMGVEGVAIVDFEIGVDGAPKHIGCIDAWPSDIFYEAAATALRNARFVVKPGATARFGTSFRMPFVFRIAGAAKLKDRGRRALPHRPVMFAAVRAAEKAAERLARRA